MPQHAVFHEGDTLALHGTGNDACRPPGTRRRYSVVSFMILGKVVELASRDALDAGAPPPPERARLLLDMTNTVQSGAKTGIQRVVREIVPLLRQAGAEGIIELPLNKVVL